MSYLQLINLDKKYSAKGNMVVKSMNLSIEQGEFIVFLGPSGCGKTTTIRMISGLEEISGGDILIEGESVVNLPPKERGVSMIFQSYAVWPHMTVYDNIAYPLKLKHVPKVEIDRRVLAAAEKTNIKDFLNRYPSQLSGGQRQRVAVSRAIVVEPKIFLMDEPLSNLDSILRVSMRSELKNIHETLKTTSIFVTHDQSEAMSLADRIVIMKDGLIEQIGTPKEVYFDCQSIFVASFIGTPPTNFFNVQVIKEQDEMVLRNQEIRYPLDAKEQEILKNYLDQFIVLGIRPESFEISSKRLQQTIMQTKADFIEPQGSHVIVISKCGEQSIKISSPILDLKPKSTIFLSVKNRQVMFFDQITEKRIR
jgi:multiple sugar transport system ATP-binding protein